jgi:hypothetical protein
MRARIVLGVFAVALLAAGSAAAEKKRVGVPRFDGPQEAVVRKAVMQVLKGEGYDVVGSREIDAAARGAGAQLDSNDGFKTVAKELSISSFVTGEVSKKKAKLTVRNGADGSVSGEGSFAGANPAKVAAEVRDGFSRRLGSAVERGRAPSGAKKPAAPPVAEAEESGDESSGEEKTAAAPPPSARKVDTSAPPPSEESTEAKPPEGDGTEGVVAKKAPEPEDTGVPGPRALDISVGVRGFTRNLSYNDVLSQMDPRYALREYKLTLGPAVVVDALLYPAAFATSSFAANIGVEAHLEQAFGVASNVPPTTVNGMPGGNFPSGATFPTVIHDFQGGVRLRLPLGANEVSVVAGGGEQAFKFKSGSGANRALLDIPDTIYTYVRIGADARFVLATGLTLGLGGAYRQVLNKGGQISDVGFFPYLTVRGMDLNAKLGYQITPSLGGRFTVDLRRYGYAMHSDPMDVMPPNMNKVAGGAVDQYLGFTLGVAYVFGGVAPGAVSEEPAAEEAPKKKHKKKKKKAADDEDAESGGDAGEAGGDESDQ